MAPASFNTINKVAAGISDTLGVALLCEAIGAGKPIYMAPWFNQALGNHPAIQSSLELLADQGVHLLDSDPRQENPFPWSELQDQLDIAIANISGASA